MRVVWRLLVSFSRLSMHYIDVYAAINSIAIHRKYVRRLPRARHQDCMNRGANAV